MPLGALHRHGPDHGPGHSPASSEGHSSPTGPWRGLEPGAQVFPHGARGGTTHTGVCVHSRNKYTPRRG